MEENKNIIERLFSSFEELEQAIESAKSNLQLKGCATDEILVRLGNYDDILTKQRHLAHALCEYIDQGDWDQVARHVSLINGLSALIKDDAKSILTSITSDSIEVESSDDKPVLC